jgi:DNA-binding response OmpR family regulator/nitrogen-specific signal transduction histidine kinase
MVEERTRELEAEKQVTERALEETRENQKIIAAQAEKLAELDEAKSRFFENISHDFRTPLTLILGPLQQAMDGQYGHIPDVLQEQHSVMLRNSQRLLNLVNSLMDLARLDAGQLLLEVERWDLPLLIRASVSAFESMAQERKLNVSIDIAEDTVCYCDRDKIEVVFTNLLANAIKYTPDGGDITVEVEESDEDISIQIADSGPGIPAEHLPHIFDRFYRVQGSSNDNVGSGLGLALSRELVELHGGKLTVECPDEGGTRFSIALPKQLRELAKTEPETRSTTDGEDTGRDRRLATDELSTIVASTEPETATVEAAEPPSDKTTVLVVEDNADLRTFIRSILGPKFRVIEAVDGEDGLTKAKSHLPDLVIADLMMPKMDGNAMNRAITADPVLKGIPIVVLTAKSGSESEVEGFQSGADAYLTKPFEAKVLLAVIEAQLASRRRLREQLGNLVLHPKKPSKTASPWLNDVFSAIDAQIDDEDLTPAEIADASHLSYSQFARRLRSETGLSPTKIIRKRRIDRAAEMLEQRAGNMTEIACAVGFKSLSYFARSFREFKGLSPGEYRGKQTKSQE